MLDSTTAPTLIHICNVFLFLLCVFFFINSNVTTLTTTRLTSSWYDGYWILVFTLWKYVRDFRKLKTSMDGCYSQYWLLFFSLISNFKVFKGYGNKCSVSYGHIYIFPTISIYILFPLKARAPYFMGYVVLQLNKI